MKTGKAAMIAVGGKEEEKQGHIYTHVLLLVSLTGTLVLDLSCSSAPLSRTGIYQIWEAMAPQTWNILKT